MPHAKFTRTLALSEPEQPTDEQHPRTLMNDQKPILIVEDEQSDAEALTRALRKLGVENPISSLRDGKEAIQYLKGEGPFADREQHPFPTVMFLDLHMPEMNGWQVLDWLRGTPPEQDLWTFVYSDPGNVGEVRDLYVRGADSFLRKPVRDIDLAALLHHFPKPWMIKAGLLAGLGG